MHQRLLIISCSNRKNKFESSIRAWQLYDGVLFRSLKKIENDGDWPSSLSVLILSAEYGLISRETKISYYDRLMSLQRAKELSSSVHHELRLFLMRNEWQEIVLSMGNVYLQTLANFKWPAFIRVGVVPGRIGEKIKLTKSWVIDPSRTRQYINWIE